MSFNSIDNSLANIRLFISGSHVGMMKDLLEENNALYGRFTTVHCLKEMDYKTVSAFYPEKTPYDKVGMYAIFGGSPSNGLLSKQIKALLNMELVSKITPINKPNDNRKARYEITDNLLRFFYTYVYSNKSALQMLGAEAFFEEYIEPSLVTFISHRFEDICRAYFSRQVQSRKLKGVLNIGTYYYDDSSTRTHGKFDVVLQRKDVFDIYEVKYLVTPMTQNQMQEEIRQVAGIKGSLFASPFWKDQRYKRKAAHHIEYGI